MMVWACEGFNLPSLLPVAAFFLNREHNHFQPRHMFFIIMRSTSENYRINFDCFDREIDHLERSRYEHIFSEHFLKSVLIGTVGAE